MFDDLELAAIFALIVTFLVGVVLAFALAWYVIPNYRLKQLRKKELEAQARTKPPPHVGERRRYPRPTH